MPGKDITKNYIRERQISPKKCAVGSFRIKNVPHRPDKKLVICCPKGHYNKKSRKCEVGTRVQSKLTKRKK